MVLGATRGRYGRPDVSYLPRQSGLCCIGAYPLHLGVHPTLRLTPQLHCGIRPTLRTTPFLHCNVIYPLVDCGLLYPLVALRYSLPPTPTLRPTVPPLTLRRDLPPLHCGLLHLLLHPLCDLPLLHCDVSLPLRQVQEVRLNALCTPQCTFHLYFFFFFLPK